ncbi:MAG: leucyl aminopeptidase [Betaproteobacteria bacterium]
MNFELKFTALNALNGAHTDALLVLVDSSHQAQLDKLKKTKASSAKSKPSTPLSISEWIAHSLHSEQLQSKTARTQILWNVPGVSAPALILAHLGAGHEKDVKGAINAAMAVLKASLPKCAHLSVYLCDVTGQRLQTAMQTIADSAYIYTTTKPSAKASTLSKVSLFAPALGRSAQGQKDQSSALEAFREGHARVQGMAFAKEWGNRPANHATPTLLGKAALGLTKYSKIKVQVLGPKEVAKLQMGSFISVAKGSLEPLRFIVMQYNGAAKSSAPVVLVGKGITFDTGGISLKAGAAMDEMKFDMCGAASVLGVFKSLGELSPKINVVGLIPACENMPDGGAVKPGDVVTSMSGQTIENLNTDAEGRLILCDALTYAERFKPRAIIDIATLTGACIIALGHLRSGLFAVQDPLAQELMRAGERSLDPCWRLPLDEEYAEGLKSNFADTANVADRSAGSITAAKFLQRFVGKMNWAHLDIAGSAWKSSGPAKGSTGRPVPLLLSYLIDQAQAANAVQASPSQKA